MKGKLYGHKDPLFAKLPIKIQLTSDVIQPESLTPLFSALRVTKPK